MLAEKNVRGKVTIEITEKGRLEITVEGDVRPMDISSVHFELARFYHLDYLHAKGQREKANQEETAKKHEVHREQLEKEKLVEAEKEVAEEERIAREDDEAAERKQKEITQRNKELEYERLNKDTRDQSPDDAGSVEGTEEPGSSESSSSSSGNDSGRPEAAEARVEEGVAVT